MVEISPVVALQQLSQLKNGLFDIIVQDNKHVMTTINARY